MAEDESQSQVKAIDDDDEDRPRRGRRGVAVDEDEEAAAARAVPAAPADWGLMPALVMIPCVLVMFLAALMSFELIHSMWGYHQPNKVSGLIVRPLAEMIGGQDLPK
jgi:hypothetical protein